MTQPKLRRSPPPDARAHHRSALRTCPLTEMSPKTRQCKFMTELKERPPRDQQ